MTSSQSPALLYELLRSFATLARNLNLSKTVRILGSTRQTVRRHISLLEAHKGETLFNVEDRQYRLTKAGRRALREAEELISRADAWLQNRTGHINGLQHLTADDAELTYYLQQHPLGRLWTDGSDLMQLGMRCWTASKSCIEDPAFAPLRPYLMIFRKLVDDWVCVEVGDKSSYSTWFGWASERSSVGRALADLPGGLGFANILALPYQEVEDSESVRLDHVHTHLKKPGSDEIVPVSFQRLLMACHFPDGSLAIASLVDRTHNISIKGVSGKVAQSMPTGLIMNSKIALA